MEASDKCFYLIGALKVHVSSIQNPEEASFFESYEAAHSLHDLSSNIAKVHFSQKIMN